jgi:hypothetical protein
MKFYAIVLLQILKFINLKIECKYSLKKKLIVNNFHEN